MSLDFELGADNDSTEYTENDLPTARETYEQSLSAGILFPGEIRKAERILRYLNKIDKATLSYRPATETVSV